MNFLDLVKALRSRVGMQGTGPSSVTSATTAEMDLVNAVSDAWIDIQNFRENWRWMRRTCSFPTVVSTTTYSSTTILGPSNRLKKWLKDTAYITVNSTKTPLRYLDYDTFIQRTANTTTPNIPSYFTIVPWSNSLMVQLPDKVYTINIDYQTTPQILLDNSDIPEIPSSFELLIVYSAVQKYSVVIYSPELSNQYMNQHDVMLGQLMRSQLPKKKINVRGIV